MVVMTKRACVNNGHKKYYTMHMNNYYCKHDNSNYMHNRIVQYNIIHVLLIVHVHVQYVYCVTMCVCVCVLLL